MFCTTLRKRPEWSTLPPTFLSSNAPKWKEQQLHTHDIAIPMSTPQQRSPQEARFLRLLLFSASDFSAATENVAMQRIERLKVQGDGGKSIGIVFLLREKGDVGSVRGSMVFANLQLSIQHIPILPLHALSSFTSTIQTFHRSIHTHHPQARLIHNPLTTLLPYCSTRPPIPQSSLNVLSEICGGVAEVAEMATTDTGRVALRDVAPVGEERVVEELVEFWGLEIIAD